MEKIYNNPEINYLKIVDYLGIEKGDTILVSSDLLNLFSKEFETTGNLPDVNKFIDSFIEKVGPEGTLLFPTYNWDFCKGVPFNWKKTKGKTGSLGNACLKRKDFKRTKHALYSFAVTGKDKDLLCDMDFSDSFGPDSVFAYLDHKHAKQVIIDVHLTHCFTFVHYVEEMILPEIEYRYIKNFTGEYIDENQESSTKTFSMFVRDLDKDVEKCYDPIEKEFIETGVADHILINGIPFIVFPDIHNTVEPILHDIRFNRSRKIGTFRGQ